ncbi:MAG: NAD-dependent epimerase/dehydratase family protein [Myxococcales bacterium]|nr:MAG: NAD-dependent epimerase/dehydratase family protein [Myxococcales bacterium]
MKAFVTGGAGFIGSNLCERLLAEGWEVVAYDNLSLGRLEFVRDFPRDHFRFVEADLLDLGRLEAEMAGADIVFHMAANSDIAQGRRQTDVDLKHGTIATYNTLEAMRRTDVAKLVFASSSAVYGEPTLMPTPEDYGPLLPISFYGASKLASEGLVSAFVHNFGLQAWVFRFGNVVGRNGTHGALVDFIRKLKRDPKRLEILGDGKQAKPYLYVSEIIDGMLYGYKHAAESLNVFNLACPGATTVDFIAARIVAAMGLQNVCFEYSGGARGWPGDVPQVRLDTSRLAALGYRTRLDSDQAAAKAADVLVAQYGRDE